MIHGLSSHICNIMMLSLRCNHLKAGKESDDCFRNVDCILATAFIYSVGSFLVSSREGNDLRRRGQMTGAKVSSSMPDE